MKILLTGASGFLGQEIYEMGKDKYEWVLFDKFAPVKGQEHWLYGDVRDRQALEFAGRGCDAVLHTAGVHTKKWEALGDDESFIINSIGTKNALQAAVNNNIPRVVFTSSIRAVSFLKQRPLPITEELEPEPNELYGFSKTISEQYCRYYTDNYGLETICLRPAAIQRTDKGIVSFNLLFEWVDIRDVARAHLLALETSFERKYEIMFIASDTPMTDIPAEAFYADPKGCLHDMAVRYGVAPGDVEKCQGYEYYANLEPHKFEWFSIEKARRLMGYNPEYGFAKWPERS